MASVHLYLLLLTSVLSVSGRYLDVGVTVYNMSPMALIGNKFVGVTIDSHLLPTSEAWNGLNFSSEKVQLLASGLSPCYLRIGGTAGDSLTFDPTGQSPDVNNTFTGSTWDTINSFVRTVGWDLIFGLNALKRKGGQWDPTNAKELLRYTAEKTYTLAGLELGNEPDIFPSKYNVTVSGTQLGRDFLSFKTMLRTLPEFDSTLIVGPDVTGVTGMKAEFFSDFFTGGGSKAVNIITFHQYYANGHTAQIDNFTDPDLMDELIHQIEDAQNVSRKTNPMTPIWLGETSSFYAGGAPGLSDRYVAGFLWLDKLGIASQMGLQGVLRQDFYGGNYPLIKTNTFDPLPDYWLTLLYKRLVGSLVLLTASNSTIVRAYAHCTKKVNPYGYMPGSVAMYLLVISNDTVKLTVPQFEDKSVDVFWLKPLGGLTSQTVTLNSIPLEVTDNKFPELPSTSATQDNLYLPGKTFGFLVFPKANLGICRT